ncbi:MAG: hypothetical protein QXW00_00995 [Candidatus Woesearchaeota archaeon]
MEEGVGELACHHDETFSHTKLRRTLVMLSNFPMQKEALVV